MQVEHWLLSELKPARSWSYLEAEADGRHDTEHWSPRTDTEKHTQTLTDAYKKNTTAV